MAAGEHIEEESKIFRRLLSQHADTMDPDYAELIGDFLRVDSGCKLTPDEVEVIKALLGEVRRIT